MPADILHTAVSAAEAGARILRCYFRPVEWRSGGESGDQATKRLEIGSKAEHDFVSRADRESEDAVVETIFSAFPDHRILAEESGFLGPADSEYEWVIDPLDGTTNFLQGVPVFAVSVACRYRGEVVAGVVLDPLGENLFSAERGGGTHWNGRRVRVSTLESLDGALLATGFPFRARSTLGRHLKALGQMLERARDIRRCGSAAMDLAHTAAGVYDGFFEFRLSSWDVAAGSLLVQEAGGLVTDLDGGARYLESGNIVAGNPGVHQGMREALEGVASEALMERIAPLALPPAPEEEPVIEEKAS